MNEPQFVEASRGPGRADPARGRPDDRRPADVHVPAGDRPPARRRRPGRADRRPSGLPGPLHQATPTAAKELIAIGETKPDPSSTPSELAAWTMIGNVILNLDEVMTKG